MSILQGKSFLVKVFVYFCFLGSFIVLAGIWVGPGDENPDWIALSFTGFVILGTVGGFAALKSNRHRANQHEKFSVENENMGKRCSMKKKLLIIAGGFFLVVTLIASLTIYSFIKELHPTHNLEKYSELRTQWNQDLVAHFPTKIPESASAKKFSHFPGFLQGGAHIQLRLRLPPGKIRELYDQFAKQRTVSFKGNEIGSMPATHFYTSNNDEDFSFPNYFEIMFFDKIPPESQRYPNHGRSHGVAISTSSSEIVYWAESW